ncbi:MAG: S-methyl-5-thioribose-1-phosphate isomerase [Spirochaetales bacterium]|nr:S-methyl-5-thioribose-1-phosphate isomerase [Spirochaetales bacterium]
MNSPKQIQEKYKTIEFRDDSLFLIDQRKLPGSLEYFKCSSTEDVEYAIKDMVVRGAPAIGATAAYGVYIAARNTAIKKAGGKVAISLENLESKCRFLEKSRPTAVNLKWAIRRMYSAAEKICALQSDDPLSLLKFEADTILAEDIKTNRAMALAGQEIIPAGAVILTHCNTGSLATGGWGTALGVIKEAHLLEKNIFVYADETRPRLQGARLTAWELIQAGIPSSLIVDSSAAVLIRDGKIDLVILGADRIAANGDVCNKIGTFMLSVLCKEYGIPFYAAAPISTIDFETDNGSKIPIEERDSREITHPGGVQTAPDEIKVYNPAFDVTPHQNVTGIITEVGILRPPYRQSIAKLRK